MNNNILKVKDLNFFYNNKSVHALKNININIPRNKVTAFIGPSGCGKSTLLRCFNLMNTLVPDTNLEGQIIYNEQNIASNVKKKWCKFWKKDKSQKQVSYLEVRTKIGMVFQKPSPFPMSIYENVAYGPKNSGIRDPKRLNQIVKDSLIGAALWDEVKDRLNDDASGMSGGQQQRLCIARAIAMEPEILLMDEPTSALDPIATAKVEELIQKLREKYTIIIVTHSMQQAARISDTTAFFYMGQLIEFDDTKKIFTNPKEELTSDYINGKMG